MDIASASPQKLMAQYFRRDRDEGVTAPDLRKECTYAEHIVRARGKRTSMTSVSLDASKIEDFGDALYQLKRAELTSDGHALVEHGPLLSDLLDSAQSSKKEERARAIQALRYAKRRREGLVRWKFNISGVESKDVINWAFVQIQKYFSKK